MKPSKKIKKKTSSSKFILIIGDEGAVLVQMQDNVVVRRLFAQSPDPANVRSIDEALASSPQSSIVVLFDMMDQSYVRQTLPPVSSFSVGKIITRRLHKDFSPEDIKGYIIIDREKTGRKDWNYLMVSLANNAVLQKWITFVTERPNELKGMGLLPLESQTFMSALEKLLAKDKSKNAPSAEWQILVSHNKVGGFRQIVMRGGKLVFTRMAQPFGESLPDVIAGNIEQEMINTLEYLKRLGLQENSSLSITIICSEEIKAALDPRNIKATECHFMTPYEVATLLSLKEAAQPGDHFGDVVLCAFIGRQRKMALRLNTVYTKKLQDFNLFIKSVKLSGVVGVLMLTFWIGMSIVSIFGLQQDLRSLETKHKVLNEELVKIKARAQILPKDMNTYSDIMMMSQTLYKKQYDVLSFAENVSGVIQDAALAHIFNWSMPSPMTVTKTQDTRQIQAEMELRLTAAKGDKARLSEQLKSITGRFKQTFPLFNITYPELPGSVSENTDIKTIISDNGSVQDSDARAQSNIIKVTLSGPQEDKTSKAVSR